MRFPQQNVRDLRLVELTPVVNVVLLLVFFFLLSWSFILQPGVEVRLPLTSASAGNPLSRHTVTMKLNAGDRSVLLFFNSKGVSETELMGLLKEAAAENHGCGITMNVDDEVPHGKVHQIADKILPLGFRLTFATQQAVSTPAPEVP